MRSVYDELSEKAAKEPRLTKHSLARSDLGLLLFSYRTSIRELWVAASLSREADVAAAVEKLRPLFGDRESRGS